MPTDAKISSLIHLGVDKHVVFHAYEEVIAPWRLRPQHEGDRMERLEASNTVDDPFSRVRRVSPQHTDATSISISDDESGTTSIEHELHRSRSALDDAAMVALAVQLAEHDTLTSNANQQRAPDYNDRPGRNTDEATSATHDRASRADPSAHRQQTHAPLAADQPTTPARWPPRALDADARDSAPADFGLLAPAATEETISPLIQPFPLGSITQSLRDIATVMQHHRSGAVLLIDPAHPLAPRLTPLIFSTSHRPHADRAPGQPASVLDEPPHPMTLCADRHHPVAWACVRGIMTDRDLRRAIAEGRAPSSSVTEMMSTALRITAPTVDRMTAQLHMLEYGVHHMPVVLEPGRSPAYDIETPGIPQDSPSPSASPIAKTAPTSTAAVATIQSIQPNRASGESTRPPIAVHPQRPSGRGQAAAADNAMVIGLVTALALSQTQATEALTLEREIATAPDLERLQRLRPRLYDLYIALHRRNRPQNEIDALLALIVRRFCEQLVAHLEPGQEAARRALEQLDLTDLIPGAAPLWPRSTTQCKVAQWLQAHFGDGDLNLLPVPPDSPRIQSTAKTEFNATIMSTITVSAWISMDRLDPSQGRHAPTPKAWRQRKMREHPAINVIDHILRPIADLARQHAEPITLKKLETSLRERGTEARLRALLRNLSSHNRHGVEQHPSQAATAGFQPDPITATEWSGLLEAWLRTHRLLGRRAVAGLPPPTPWPAKACQPDIRGLWNFALAILAHHR
ncbi:MAG: hypothetical protein ACK4IT_10570 [Thioalkalivibrionaceae bacterium]